MKKLVEESLNEEYAAKDENNEKLYVGDFVKYDPEHNYHAMNNIYEIYSIDSNGNMRVRVPGWISGNPHLGWKKVVRTGFRG